MNHIKRFKKMVSVLCDIADHRCFSELNAETYTTVRECLADKGISLRTNTLAEVRAATQEGAEIIAEEQEENIEENLAELHEAALAALEAVKPCMLSRGLDLETATPEELQAAFEACMVEAGYDVDVIRTAQAYQAVQARMAATADADMDMETAKAAIASCLAAAGLTID